MTYDPKAPRAKAHKLGCYSKRPALAKLDRRTKEAGYIEWVRHDLTQAVGGSPSIPQKMLIERAAVLSLRLAKIDQKIIDDADLTLHDNNFVIAWTNALRRVLQALGIDGPTAPPVAAMSDVGAEPAWPADSAAKRALSELQGCILTVQGVQSDLVVMIGSGMLLSEALDIDGMPARRTVYSWLRTDKEFAAAFEQARLQAADALDEEIHRLANAITPETAAAARVQIEALKWRASKMHPARYGPPASTPLIGENTVNAEGTVSLATWREGDDRLASLTAQFEGFVAERSAELAQLTDEGEAELAQLVAAGEVTPKAAARIRDWWAKAAASIRSWWLKPEPPALPPPAETPAGARQAPSISEAPSPLSYTPAAEAPNGASSPSPGIDATCPTEPAPDITDMIEVNIPTRGGRVITKYVPR